MQLRAACAPSALANPWERLVDPPTVARSRTASRAIFAFSAASIGGLGFLVICSGCRDRADRAKASKKGYAPKRCCPDARAPDMLPSLSFRPGSSICAIRCEKE